MLHNIEPERYHCEYTPRAATGADYLMAFRNNEILLNHTENGQLPRVSELPDVRPDTLQYLFEISGRGFFLCPDAPAETDALGYQNTRALRAVTPLWMAFAGVTAYHLSVWYRRTRYCGACGQRMVHKQDERAMLCPDCGNIRYPDMSVAIIVGVRNGEKLLLTRYAGRGFSDYALIAGFCEIGESLEDTIRREVMEETGVRVKNIQYYDNQPWGYSQSLLVGFFADLDGDETIRVDGVELAEALWVPRAEVQDRSGDISMTAKMMDAFRRGLI